MPTNFQFQTRTLLAVISLIAVGMALSVNASIGARVVFVASFSLFWLGVTCVTFVVDRRERGKLAMILTLMFGQAIVLTSACAMIVSLGIFLRTLITPVFLAG